MSKKQIPDLLKQEEAEQIVDAITTVDVEDLEETPKIGDDPDKYNWLTDRQRLIVHLRMRGLSQYAIANALGTTQAYISQELKKVRTKMAERGATIEQDVFVGETTLLYEEVEARAWEIFHGSSDDKTDKGDKLKALALVMTAREKQTKLLAELGLLTTASKKITHEVIVPPFLKQLESNNKENVVKALIDSTLTKLPDPEPPQYDDIEDAIIVEDVKDDNKVDI